MSDSLKSTRFNGVILILISATVFSSAGLFVKGVEASFWAILFWRGISAVVFTTFYLGWRGSLRREYFGMGWTGLAASIVAASGTIAFIPAFKFTTIANVSLIYAAAPFVSAAIAWIWMREKPAPAILFASLAAFSGVLMIVSGSLGSIRLQGDLLALWMTVAMSGYLCVYRRYPETPAAGPAALSSIILLPVAWIMGDPMSAAIYKILITCLFGLVFAVASVTLAEGARRLPATETALIGALEIPLAPLWALLIFGEVVMFNTLVGGGIVLVAVFGSQLWGRKFLPGRCAGYS